MIAPHVSHAHVLERITRTIVERFNPVRVALFGSRARGDAREDSDYDILVVVDEQPRGLDGEIRDAVRNLGSIEIFVRTSARYEEDTDDVGTLAYAVEHEGRILYERETLRRVREKRRGPPRSLAAWLRRAENDFGSMDRVLSDPEPLWDTICFHAHQGVEKLLKCVLIANHVAPPRTHDLPSLLKTCPAALRENADLRGACAMLWDLYPRTRYPEDDEPTPSEGADAVAAARMARDILIPAIRSSPS